MMNRSMALILGWWAACIGLVGAHIVFAAYDQILMGKLRDVIQTVVTEAFTNAQFHQAMPVDPIRLQVEATLPGRSGLAASALIVFLLVSAVYYQAKAARPPHTGESDGDDATTPGT